MKPIRTACFIANPSVSDKPGMSFYYYIHRISNFNIHSFIETSILGIISQTPCMSCPTAVARRGTSSSRVFDPDEMSDRRSHKPHYDPRSKIWRGHTVLLSTQCNIAGCAFGAEAHLRQGWLFSQCQVGSQQCEDLEELLF